MGGKRTLVLVVLVDDDDGQGLILTRNFACGGCTVLSDTLSYILMHSFCLSSSESGLFWKGSQ